jgi:hypothetical protein
MRERRKREMTHIEYIMERKNRERIMWLKSLEIGDKVAVKREGGILERTTSVSDVSPTTIQVEAYHHLYSRKTGWRTDPEAKFYIAPIPSTLEGLLTPSTEAEVKALSDKELKALTEDAEHERVEWLKSLTTGDEVRIKIKGKCDPGRGVVTGETTTRLQVGLLEYDRKNGKCIEGTGPSSFILPPPPEQPCGCPKSTAEERLQRVLDRVKADNGDYYSMSLEQLLCRIAAALSRDGAND